MEPASVMDRSDASFLAQSFGSSLPFPAVFDPSFENALSHVIDNPGSLVRPKLVFEMVTAYGVSATRAEQLSIALEYFHTASLLFDDLHCMDNALERRGTPTRISSSARKELFSRRWR